MSRCYALVDCNSFYASCERLFRPDLRQRPVIVLSNNDGCVVSLSREAKDLGIPMGVPYHQIRDWAQQHGVAVFSSNYALYGDLSNRVMRTLEQLAPRIEIYSIDEAFADLGGMQRWDLAQWGRQVRQTVLRHCGLPVCVGIAPTKTLAKLANHVAKGQRAQGGGVIVWQHAAQWQPQLAQTEVEAIWGIGRRLGRQLRVLQIDTAADLAAAHLPTLRKQFSVSVERIARELNGVACLGYAQMPAARAQILCSRSFGRRLTRQQDLAEALCHFACQAAEKLRAQQQRCRELTIFIRTHPFAASGQTPRPAYANQAAWRFLEPTADSRDLMQACHALLASIWRPGYQYLKAGVILRDFYAAGSFQPELFAQAPPRPRSAELMQVIDRINRRGGAPIRFAGQGLDPQWQMRREHLSPAYTTDWRQLPLVTLGPCAATLMRCPPATENPVP